MNLKVDLEHSWGGPEFAGDMYNEMVEGFYKVACRIRDRARGLVPVGILPHPAKASPEHLISTIRARKARRKRLQQLLSFITEQKGYYKDDPAAFVFAGDRRNRVYWHYWVEFGTYGSPAHPFMRPAINASFNAVTAEAERAGRRAVNRRRHLRKMARRRAA